MPSERTFTLEEIAELADALGIKQKHDPASTSLANSQIGHGAMPGLGNVYGVFSGIGARPEMFSAMPRPTSVIRAIVQAGGLRKSDVTDAELEIMTGQTAGTGSNPNDFCGNPPTIGDLKTCKQRYGWGWLFTKTNLQSLPDIGQRRNFADVPRSILNAGPTGNPLIPDLMYRLTDTRSQLSLDLFKLGVQIERQTEVVAIQGDDTQAPAATELGWIKEFDGADQQVKTGYVDHETQVACPAADSAVITFGVDVGATNSNGDNIVQAAHDLYYGLSDRARRVGMEGVQWAWWMRSEAFRSIVEQWACQYATYRCASVNAGQPFVTDTRDANELRIAMLNGQYLLNDGLPVPVLFTEGIAQTTPTANTLESDAFLMPMSWAGMPLTTLEYFDMANQYLTEFKSFVDADAIDTINDGLYLVGSRSAGFCVELLFGAKMRMIVETPFLAGRLDNIRYAFNAPIRNALPGASFYADGGSTRRL